MIRTQRKSIMCCRNLCFIILIVSIGIGNGESNEDLKAMVNNFLKINQAIEARMEAMEMKMHQVIEHIWQKLDSGNIPTDEGLMLSKVTQVPKMNDTDLETRVQALELQMEDVQEDVSYIEAEVTNIEGEITIVNADVSVLFQGQLNQDEKIEDLEDVSEGLDTRVTTLDESVTEAINELNSDVLYLNGTVVGLQSADIELDSRLETLEEFDISAEIENLDSRLESLELDGTVAFHVGFTDTYPVVPIGGVAVWDYIFFNLGDGYNTVTGEFVVPPGGAGLYYFNVHFLFDVGEFHLLNIRHNGEYLCMAFEDNRQSGDHGGSACGAVVQLAEGDAVDVYHLNGSNDTPCDGFNYYSTFSGFRIAPA